MVRPESGSRSFAAILGLHNIRTVVDSTSLRAKVWLQSMALSLWCLGAPGSCNHQDSLDAAPPAKQLSADCFCCISSTQLRHALPQLGTLF